LSIDSGRAIPESRLEAAPLAERTVDEQRLHDSGDAG
jgi:RNA polymerase-binding transcription factor DksA